MQSMEVVAPPAIDFEKRILQYRTIRDRLAEMDARHKEERRPLVEAKEMLEGWFLEKLRETNQENAQTKEGTVHKTTKRSASISDSTEFLNFIIENRAWEMLDLKANVTAATEYIEEHGEAPPGVNFSSRITIGVMAPRTKG